MIKRFIYVALIAVLGLLAVGCQKEQIADMQNVAAETSVKYVVTYSLDGTNYQASLQNDKELEVLLRQLVAYARQGYRVVVADNVLSSREVPSKETFMAITNPQE